MNMRGGIRKAPQRKQLRRPTVQPPTSQLSRSEEMCVHRGTGARGRTRLLLHALLRIAALLGHHTGLLLRVAALLGHHALRGKDEEDEDEEKQLCVSA